MASNAIRTILVIDLPPQTTENELTIYFQSFKKSGGGDVEKVDLVRHSDLAIITFEAEQACDRVLRREHELRGRYLTISVLPERAAKEFMKHCAGEPLTDYSRTAPVHTEASQRTVRVTRLPKQISEDAVRNYFENKRRSKGGATESVVLRLGLNLAFVTFCSPFDARRTAEHQPHLLEGSILDVKLLEEGDTSTATEQLLEDCSNNSNHDQDTPTVPLTFVVSGINPQSTEDTLTNYLENSRRSGGGSVKQIVKGSEEGEATVFFDDVDDLERLLQGPHRLDSAMLTIVEKKPEQLDQRKVLVSGLSTDTTNDCLELYLEKISDNNRVEQIDRGYGDNVLVKFSTKLDFEVLFNNAQEAKPLDGSMLHLQRIPECNAVMITGLSERTTKDAVELYFDSKKKSGGGNVDGVDVRKESSSAVVHFASPSVVDDVLKRTHTLDEVELTVQPHYPFLVDNMPAINLKKREIELQTDPEVITYLKKYHTRELDTILDEYHCNVEWDEGSTAITICPINNQQLVGEEWTKHAKSVEDFIYSFEKKQVSFDPDIWKQIRSGFKMIEEESAATANVDISFKDSDFTVQITGKTASVTEVVSKLQTIQKAAEENEELKRTVIKSKELDIPKSKLLLLQSSRLCEELENENQYLKIAVDPKKGKICLEGPKKQLQDVSIKMFTFISKVAEKVFKCPQRVLDVLKEDAGTAYVANLFSEKEVEAIVCHEQGQNTNEALIVGMNATHARNAEEALRETVDEISMHLEDENAQLLNSKIWKDLKAKVEQEHVVKLHFDSHTGSLWISGVDEHVKLVAEIAKSFIETNTILTDIVALPKGCTRFLIKVWKDRLVKMQTDLALYSFRFRHEVDFNGIEISGTAEGLVKGAAEVAKLCEDILEDNVTIDKPGLRKFLSQQKETRFLKSIEDEHSCIIEKIEEINESSLAPVAYGGARTPAGECKCSYITQEGKKVSVYKDDLTRHQVDVIVNAANGNLQHVGGLAGAVVKAGGKEIQEECDVFIRKEGPLLDGQVMVSKPGNLPCKKIIHAAGPKWGATATHQKSIGKKPKEEGYLKFAVLTSLERAADYSSIAIPAISSGVFGFPRELCAKIIIETVQEFCKDNPTCNLTDIRLTNHDDLTVNVFKEEMKNQFGHQSNFYDLDKRSLSGRGDARRSQPTTLSRKGAVATNGGESFHTAEGICVSLRVGSIVG